MNLQDEILNFAQQHKKFNVADFLHFTKNRVTRPYCSKIFTELVNEKKLVRAGQSYRTVYSLPENIRFLGNVINLRIKNTNIQEHKVLENIQTKAPFILKLKDNVRSIFDYAFSEMLNNAIEHSKSKFIEIKIAKKDNRLSFEIRDFGIGVFRNVKKARHLGSEFEAMQDLLKGKTTTAPKAHSGEGIFFTSKVADLFTLDSYGFEMTVDNLKEDVFIGESKKTLQGTKVVFSLVLNTKKHLINIFKKYQTEKDNYAFDKTEVQIKLYTMGTVHISRSQARRILSGLDKFKLVILDFDKVPTVGQAFADEIFRVFFNKHPDIKIVPINMNEAIAFMIGRVEK